ncbi:MAG TPA: hypothetical protein VK421_15565 [Pyrinomonadaceae bacterium]|nr:hypothetical protein [Pyrinomonadaceae bacterium]
MFLVLAHHGDPLAARVYERLRARHGATRARLLTADDLALSTRWALRQDGERVETLMSFPDGTRISSAEIAAVFNRLCHAVAPHFAAAPEADRDYALMETHAFLLSWMAALPRVINPARPRGLGGDVRGVAEWLLLAGRAGLPARGMRFATSARLFPKPAYEAHVPLEGAGLALGSPVRPASRATLGSAPAHFLEPVGEERRRIVVVGSRAYGDGLPPKLADKCLRLAREVGCELAEFSFARATEGSGWRFCGGGSFPFDLPEPETGALVELLEAGGEG